MLDSLTDRFFKRTPGRDAEAGHQAHTIAVCSRKGGVGKTTVASHLAVALARWHDARVLLVDLDPQGHVSKALGNLLSGEGHEPLSGVFLSRRGDILDACVESDEERLWIAPADDRMADVQTVVASRIGREFLLRNAMTRAQALFDFVVFDCPPNVDALTVNALVAARHVLVPSDLSLLSIEGVSDIHEAVSTVRDHLGHPVSIAGIVLSRVDRRATTVNNEVLGRLQEQFGDLVMEATIPANTAVARACLRGAPVFDIDPAAPASQGYRGMTQELCQRLQWEGREVGVA